MKHCKLLISLMLICSLMTGCSIGGYTIVKEDELNQPQQVQEQPQQEVLIPPDQQEDTQVVNEPAQGGQIVNEPAQGGQVVNEPAQNSIGDTQLTSESVEYNAEGNIEEPSSIDTNSVVDINFQSKISLSSLEEGVTYRMSLKEGRIGKSTTYDFMNTTGYNVFIYTQEDDSNVEIGFLKLKYSFPKAVNAGSGGIKSTAKHILFRYEKLKDTNAVLNHADSSRMIKLSKKKVGRQFKIGNARYLYNNTNDTILLKGSTGVEYTIPAKTVVEFASQGYSWLKRLR